MKSVGLWVLAASSLVAQPRPELIHRNRPVLDAHNCYPYDGKWSDRIDRALSAGFPVSIEQDLTWHVAPGATHGRPILVHNLKTVTGSEPGPREYFFERVRPIVEKALKDGKRSQWPLIVVHFDFKSNEPALLNAIWDMVGEYEGWITTARKSADPSQLTAFDVKPILILTEDNDLQEEVFYRRLPVGSKLRLFGSAHAYRVTGDTDQERLRALVATPPEQLLRERPTTYRRWWNNSWYAVEEGGQRLAGEWTAADNARLRSLVGHAHRLGFAIRFYTLNGVGSSSDLGWDPNYNFGSRQAVLPRWKAALAAGVDMISTDQYEELAIVMGRSK